MAASPFRRRYRYMRSIGADWLSALFVAVLNEFSNLPPHKVGFMTWVADMEETKDGR